MDVVFTSLEALILKATQECLSAPDPPALDAFCAVMRDAPEGAALAARTLAARVHAGSPREALLALSALDRCMRRGDAALHCEVGKFRFLNEMIKLVSPKYYADRTAPEVQQRVLQLLHAWTIEYPKETKFKVAFDMLRSQGVVKETPPPLPPEPGAAPAPPARPRAATFEDDEKSKLLQKLLQSKNPVDLQFANKLIKTMVREEERRTEADGRRALELRQAVESARLLQSLLEQAADAGEDERQLMRELEEACLSHHAALIQAPTVAEAFEEILGVIDELSEVLTKCQAVMAPRLPSPPERGPRMNGAESLLDLGAAGGRAPGGGDLDVLSDIFSTENGAAGAGELLQPFSLLSSEAGGAGGAEAATRGGARDEAAGLAALDSLGAELLQRSLTGPRADGFAGKSAKKIPMNAIETSSSPADTAHLDLDFLLDPSRATTAHALPSPAVSPPRPAPAASLLDDLMVDISMGSVANCDNVQNVSKNLTPVGPQLSSLAGIFNSQPATAPTKQNLSVSNSTPIKLTDFDGMLTLNNPKTELFSPSATVEKPLETSADQTIPEPKELKESSAASQKVEALSDVEMSLMSVESSSVPPLTILAEEEGLTVVLHLAANRPRPDVNVLVLSVTSRHKSPISEYKFHAVVPKGCKVRVLPPSGACLPPHSAFLAPTAILQLVLVARPASAPARPSLRFVVTYACGGESLTEMGEVAELPLDLL